ncbi:MAG: ImmA/IrrE family metallo-endopeptidase [Solirubrobacteraceae bacterium]
MTIAPFTRARIERLCSDAVRRAGLAGVLPTPLDALAEALGVRERVELPPQARVLGALWFEQRALFVERTQSRARRRFTEAHELGHLLCPWHRAIVRLDTAGELFGSCAVGIEAEANLAAGELIFQGPRFTAEAAEHERSLRTPLALADAYGASGHAAAHHYVERHAEPLALLVAGRWPDASGRLSVWRSVESPAFAAAFGRLAEHLPHVGVRGPLGDALEAARRSSEPVATAIALGGRTFRAEVLNNRHCQLILVAGGRHATARRLAA